MRNKTKLIVIAILVVLLALAIAYASFSGVLNISGKATASGNFEVIFTNGVVSTSDHGTAVVNQADTTKMNVDVKLGYPGDGCYVTTTVKNNGTVAAALSGFNIYNQGTTTTFASDDIEVLIPDLDTTGNEVLQPGESCTITFTVKWKRNSTETEATANFDIELDYQQATQEFTGSESTNN